MATQTLTGSRIRERRGLVGIKQADLARSVGISAAYLNLIEHNRRKIGGKLLVDIARALGVDVSTLSEGADKILLDALEEAAQGRPHADLAPNDPPQSRGRREASPEIERREEFAGRFPGWAALIAAQNGQISQLEKQVDALNDRLAHDPYLSQALHDILSTVTSIRSAAGILNGPEPLEADWLARFHRNVYEDSQRLADGAQELVQYLDDLGQKDASKITPMETFDLWLAARDYAYENALEMARASENARSPNPFIAAWMTRAIDGVSAMPLDVVDAVLAEFGVDPLALSRRAGVPLSDAIWRLGSLPIAPHRPPMGLFACDGTGQLIFKKPLEGFFAPSDQNAQPNWPLFSALRQVSLPLKKHVQTPQGLRFESYSLCLPKGELGFDSPAVLEAVMLVVQGG